MRLRINKVIWFLIWSDFALIGGFGLISPIFAVYLTNRIHGGDIRTVGFAAAIYWLTNSIAVLPISKFLDINQGEKDDLWAVITGNLLAVCVVIGYIFASLPYHIYILQSMYALAMALNAPGYLAIFTRHIDKKREAFDWSVRSSLIGIGAGASGAIGGVVASNFGFNTLFISVAIFVLISALLLLFIYENMSESKKKIPRRLISLKQ